MREQPQRNENQCDNPGCPAVTIPCQLKEQSQDKWTEDSVSELWHNGGCKRIASVHNTATKKAYKKGWNEHKKYRRLAF